MRGRVPLFWNVATTETISIAETPMGTCVLVEQLPENVQKHVKARLED